MPLTYSHFSIFEVPFDARAKIVVPGANDAPDSLGFGTEEPQFLGYVRCRSLVGSSWKARYSAWDPDDGVESDQEFTAKLPFRDYPLSLRSSIRSIATGLKNVLVVSARNVANEVHYQARVARRTYRTARDRPLPGSWPVLGVGGASGCGLAMRMRSEFDGTWDLLSGVPLVIDGIATGRAFAISHSSDVSHSYPVDPSDRFGVAGAWLPLSEAWNQWHGRRLVGEAMDDETMARELDHLARRCGVTEEMLRAGNPLPHSVVAVTSDGRLRFLVVTGSVWGIADLLASHQYRHAMVLDQSGSVGHAFVDEKGMLRTLVSTSNYRDSGTCFLLIETAGFVVPSSHALLPSVVPK